MSSGLLHIYCIYKVFTLQNIKTSKQTVKGDRQSVKVAALIPAECFSAWPGDIAGFTLYQCSCIESDISAHIRYSEHSSVYGAQEKSVCCNYFCCFCIKGHIDEIFFQKSSFQ